MGRDCSKGPGPALFVAMPPRPAHLLPQHVPSFPQIVDGSVRVLAEEAARQAMMLVLRKELPYSTQVSVERVESPPEGSEDAIVITVRLLPEHARQLVRCV